MTLALLEIPVGTATDGASIPDWFWGVVISPFHPRVIYAALYHDYAYRTQPDRKVVDDNFYRLLIVAGVSRVKAALMYRAVRAFGGRYFRRVKNEQP